ncbi:Acetyltransferase, GNAT [Bacillus thuringiensis serovar pakistani str. T13001]|nr:Acetyltransferase, GNAT [Bacillus thuringiensis serovar pakistani str. T13001]
MRNLVIEEIKQLENDMEELSKLLKMVVNDGASIGFFASTGTKRRNKVLANSISARSDIVCG